MGILLFRHTMSARWSLLLMLENLLSCAPHIASGIQLYAESAPSGYAKPAGFNWGMVHIAAGENRSFGPWTCTERREVEKRWLELRAKATWFAPSAPLAVKISGDSWFWQDELWGMKCGYSSLDFRGSQHSSIRFQAFPFWPQKPRAWIFIKIFFLKIQCEIHFSMRLSSLKPSNQLDVSTINPTVHLRT